MASDVYTPAPEAVEKALDQGRDLAAWWQAVEPRLESGSPGFDLFDLYPASPEAGLKATRGFFAEVSAGGEKKAVMGHVSDAFYDRPMVPRAQRKQAAERTCAQVEEFALRYWLRNQVDVEPEPLPELGHIDLPPYLQVLSWTPPPELDLEGVNNVQSSYKTIAGVTGTFDKNEATRIIDLRALGKEYAWVQLNRRLLSVDLTLTATQELSLVIPLARVAPVAMDSSLIVNRTNPGPGILGAYGPGFARIDHPQGLLRVGPDAGQPGLELQYLQVHEDGEVRLRSVTIMPVPAKLFDLSWNPAQWSLGMLDRFTFGMTRPMTKPIRDAMDRLPSPPIDPILAPARLLNWASGDTLAKTLCATKRDFLVEILALEASKNLHTLLATRQIWQTGKDWLKPETLPAWVRSGGPPQPPALPAQEARS